MLLTGKDRPSELPSRLDEMRAEANRLRRAGCLVVLAGLGVGCVFLAIAVLVLGGEDGGILTLVVGIMALVFGGIGYSGHRTTVAAMDAKIDFVSQFTREFADDFHPAGKVHYHIDLRAYDVEDKRYWTGRSTHGNTKFRYADKWFRAKFYLADGTCVIVERRADVKVRKGQVVKDKRRLYLKVIPNAKTFGGGPYTGTDLDQMVRQTVVDSFHDPPEGLKVAREGDRPDLIALKVTQLDADFLGREVLVLVEAVLLYLRMRA